MNIKFDIEAVSPGQYYTPVKISHMKVSDGSNIVATKYLYVSFLSPVPLNSTNIQFAQWDKKYVVYIVDSKKIYEDHYEVTFRISAEDFTSFTIDNNTVITIALNSPAGKPDLRNIDDYIKETKIEHDHLPHIGGTVKITADSAPVPALAEVTIPLSFSIDKETTYSFDVKPGSSIKKDIFAHDYVVSCKGVSNSDKTVYSEVICSPKTIQVKDDKISELHLSYAEVKHYSVLKFNVADIKELAHESLHVSLKVEKSYSRNFNIKPNNTITLFELPNKGDLSVEIKSIRLNNKIYSFKIDTINLKGAVEEINISHKNLVIDNIDDKNFLPLHLSVSTEHEFPNNFQLLELINENTKYSTLVEIKNNKEIVFPVKVAAGEYKIICSNFIEDKKVYVVNTEKSINISTDVSSIALDIKEGANLDIRGFDPMHLTFGGCATLEATNIDYFAVAKPSSIFKYAGVDGAGDPTTILERDESTERTIALARSIEAKFIKQNSKHNVLPVMISYTAQLSGGDLSVLQNEEGLKNSFANYILTLQLLNSKKDDAHSVPGGIIVNPDMLGSILQHSMAPTYSMPVKQPLKDAIEARKDILKTLPEVPSDITEDLKGYIYAVNWLTRTIAADVTFGWQVNLWGIDGGGSQWIYNKTPDTKHAAKQIANFINIFKVYSGAYKPDFLAIDRYEADDFTKRSYMNSYCYGPKEWEAYFDFCADLSAELKLGVMPWQIPASRTPLVSDSVNKDFDSQHWGTAGTYILGDQDLGKDIQQIHPIIRDFSFKEHAPAMSKLVGNTPGEMYKRNKDFDVSKPAYTDFPLKGIFHIELGGGSTVGMIPPLSAQIDMSWSNNKLKDYAANPVTFNNTLIKH